MRLISFALEILCFIYYILSPFMQCNTLNLVCVRVNFNIVFHSATEWKTFECW